MKKILSAALMATLLSGCQVLDLVQGTPQKASKVSKPVLTPAQTEVLQKLDAQFQRISAQGIEIEFNGEKYVKQTQAVKGDDPRFVSLALSKNSEARKAVLSDTFYLTDVSHEKAITERYFAKNKETCQLQAVKSDIHDYYACANDKFKRYVALVHKDKNIIAYRSYTSYQVEPTQAEERAIIKALVDYPFDSIAR